MTKAVISLQNIKKQYLLGDTDFWALKGVSFEVMPGEFVALMGPSGSGKSTLMNILGILDRQTEGHYLLDNQDVTDLSENKRAEVRNATIGFVFQSFHLLPRFNLMENVEVPLRYAGYAPQVRRERALDMLERVGLADKARNLPSQISGGQKQRVAVARALAVNPALLLADEPTGNLDTKTGDEIMTLFRELNDDGATIVVVTHEPEIAEQTKRTVKLRDGLLESDDVHKQRRTASYSQTKPQYTGVQ